MKMASSNVNKSNVELGILEECDKFLLESRFFPSKLGGKPAWLALKELPTDLTCGVCASPCILLCQVYAPIDSQPSCHHRTIFLFICPDPLCCKNNNSDNLKVFRCQLPAKNEFYPAEDPIEEESWHPECRIDQYNKVCELCGNPAPFSCAKCKTTNYCTKKHQVVHWKLYGHKLSCCKDSKEVQIEVPFLFPELEITIDKAPEEVEDLGKKNEEELLGEYQALVDKGAAGSLTGHDLDQYAAVKDDKYFSKYKEWIDKCPEQVLRYERGGQPLFVSKPETERASIPTCQYCGGKRQFEFQILSTLLNEVSGNGLLNNLDWGTLLVYTCANNCSDGPRYKPEFIYKQDIAQ